MKRKFLVVAIDQYITEKETKYSLKDVEFGRKIMRRSPVIDIETELLETVLVEVTDDELHYIETGHKIFRA